MFVAVQLLSQVRLSATPWTAALQASLSFTIPQSLMKLMSIELVMPSNHLILCHSFLLLPLVSPRIRLFSNESAIGIRWPKYWSFSFSISPSNEYLWLISFRIGGGGGLVAQSCLTLCEPMDYSSPGSSVHGILQARTLEWVAISLSRGSSWPRNWTWVSCIADGFFTIESLRKTFLRITFAK